LVLAKINGFTYFHFPHYVWVIFLDYFISATQVEFFIFYPQPIKMQ